MRQMVVGLNIEGFFRAAFEFENRSALLELEVFTIQTDTGISGRDLKVDLPIREGGLG